MLSKHAAFLVGRRGEKGQHGCMGVGRGRVSLPWCCGKVAQARAAGPEGG